eukprot:jgi/Ulvmu1/12168/UM085_0032.1
MASVQARIPGDSINEERPLQKKRSPITFPADNTDLNKKLVEPVRSQAADLRKQSPSSGSATYVGVHLDREHAVESVLAGLLPIPESCVRILTESWETYKEVTVIISELRSDVVLGYAQLSSAPLRNDSVHNTFHGAASVCEVTWCKFGEFSKNIFSSMPFVVRSHIPGTVFNVKLGAEVVRILERCAQQYALPSPVTVASNWREIMRQPKAQPTVWPTAQQAGFGASCGGLLYPRGMPDDHPPMKRPRQGVLPARRFEQGGFISRHEAERNDGARGRHKIPPAILAVLHDAPVMRERPTARKRLVQLTFEEYLDVYGRIEEEWHRRQLEQACINSGLNVKSHS